MKETAFRVSFYAAVALLALGSENPVLGQTPDSLLVGTCEKGESEAYLDVGNVRARIPNGGGLFYNREPHVYNVPKTEPSNAIFSAGFSISGLVDGQIRSAGHRHASGDFWPGPLDDDGKAPDDCSEFDRIYNIYRADVESALQGGAPTEDIIDWPYHLGAPVFDGDGNPDNYNWIEGDRPEILGDQMIWWILNDRGNTHTRFDTIPIGIEIRASAFAFGPGWGFVQNTTFYRYKIKNRNTRPIQKIYAGLFNDVDLGDFDDDYVGSDSSLGLAFYYNQDNEDGGHYGYGTPPPAIGFTAIKGPQKDLGGAGTCRRRSGEELGLTGFITGKNSAEPRSGVDLYDTLRSRWWQTGERMAIGDNEWDLQFSEIPTRWIYPGDPITGAFWSAMNIDGLGTASRPGDKRGYINIGPFCLDPGEETEIVFAIIWSIGADHLDSVRQLRREARIIRRLRDDLLTPLEPRLDASALRPPQYALSAFHNYPDPFSEETTIAYSLPQSMYVRLTIHDLLGREIVSLVNRQQEAGEYVVRYQPKALPSGVFLARLQLDRYSTTQKIAHIK